jgi:pyridoxal/pyridoxine/pyridoxamine kinase
LTRIWELITVSFSAREHKYKAQVQPLSIDNGEDMMQDIKEVDQDIDQKAVPLIKS